jgi:O-antigen/teichoic acid export membrane protein
MVQAYQKVPKNILVTGAGQVLGTGLAALVTILTARYLGVEGFGRFSFLYGLAIVVAFISEGGLTNILTRELSQRLHEPAEYHACLGAFRGLISCISLFIVILASLISLLVGFERDLKVIIILLGICIAAVLQAANMLAVVRAHEDMEYFALGFNLQNFFQLGSIYLIVYLDAGFVPIFLAYTVSYFFLWGYYWLVVRLRYGLGPLIFNLPQWKYFLKESTPLGLGLILRRAANYVDIFFLRVLSNLTYVGLFSAAYRFTLALSGAAMAVCYPFLPVFSKLALDQDPQLAAGLEKGLLFMVVTAVPLTVFLFVYGKEIIPLFFGANFTQAIWALKILSFSLVFIFPSTLLLQLFTALGKQRLWTLCTGLCLGIHTILDLTLIPRWGHIGAAIATLVAEFGLFALAWFLMRRLAFHLSVLRLARPLLAGGVIGGWLYFFPGKSLQGVIGSGTGAMLLYGMLLWTLGVFTMKGMLSFVRNYQPWRKAG